MLYLSSDAIHVFPQAFYDKLHQDLSTELSPGGKYNHVRYTTTTVNDAIIENQRLLKTFLYPLDKIRYALSGSEAVETAFRDVRMNTGKRFIVRFSNAYHGKQLFLVTLQKFPKNMNKYPYHITINHRSH